MDDFLIVNWVSSKHIVGLNISLVVGALGGCKMEPQYLLLNLPLHSKEVTKTDLLSFAQSMNTMACACTTSRAAVQ